MSAYVVSDDTINFIVSRASELNANYVYAGKSLSLIHISEPTRPY